MSAFSNKKAEWLQQLAAGDVNTVIISIKEALKNDKEGKLGFSLLSTVASVLSSGKHSDLRPEDIHQICQLCFDITGIDNLTLEKYKFLCTTYHILKYLISQGKADLAQKLSVFILPVTCSADDSESCNILYNCFYLFYQITTSEHRKFFAGQVDISSLLSICKHSLKFLSCCIGKYLLNILDIAVNIIKGSKKCNNNEQLEYVQFVKDILDLTSRSETKRNENITNESLYKAYMTLLKSALEYIIEAKCTEETQIILEKIFRCLSAWSKNDKTIDVSFKFLKDILNVLLDQPSNYTTELQRFVPTLEKLTCRFGDNPCFGWTCIVISHTIMNLCSQWILFKKEEWNSQMSAEAQNALCSFIMPLSEVFQTSSCLKCTLPSGEKCNVGNDTIFSLNLLLVIVNYISSSLSFKSDGHLRLLSNVYSTLNEAITRLKVLKSGNCLAWKDMWKRYAIKIYNLGIYCKTAEYNTEAKEFYSMFCWTCLTFGEQPVVEEGVNGLLGKGLQLLSRALKDLRKLRGALRVIAIGLIVAPDLKEYFQNLWTRIKISCSSNKNSNILTLTIYDILMEDKSIIEQRCPDIDYSKIDFTKLLFWELEGYSCSSIASNECVQRAYEKLCMLSPNSYALKMEAVLLLFPLIWFNGSIKETSDFISSVEALTEEFKKSSESAKMEKVKQLCLLGNIHYWLFMSQLKVTRATREIEIQKCEIIPTKLETQEDNPDHLANCDVIPAYKNLTVENETQFLSILNEALSFWFSALKAAKGQNVFLEHLNPLKNIQVTAFIYELYHYDQQMLKTWCLYYKYAEISEKKEEMLRGICQLIEWCTCGTSDCKWLTKAQELLKELNSKEKKDFQSEMLYHKYLLAYAYHCIRNKKVLEVSSCVEELSEFTDRNKLVHFEQSILHVKVGLLILEYKITLPSDATYPKKREMHIINEAYLTYVGAVSLTRQERMTPVENMEVLSLMLRVSLYVGQMFLDMFWPREARCYMRSDLLLAQQLGLVTRTSEFLNLLALVDAMCCKVDDCQVKLQGMEYLLQLDSRFQPSEAPNYKQDRLGVNEDLASDIENLDINGWMTEYRNLSAKRNGGRSPCASPALQKTKFIKPSFLNHPCYCSCSMCSTITLQTLVLYATYIQAEIYRINSDVKEAMEFFRSALKTYKKCLEKQEKLIEKSKFELDEILFDVKGDTQQNLQLLLLPLKICYVKIARSYADFLAVGRLIDPALKWNKETDQQVKLLSTVNPLISLDVKAQMLFIKHLETSAKVLPKGKEESHLGQNMALKQSQFANCRTPLISSSALNRLNIPSTGKSREDNGTQFKIMPRKLILTSTEDCSAKANTAKNVHAAKKKEGSVTVPYEDSPGYSENENSKTKFVRKTQISHKVRSTKKSALERSRTSKCKTETQSHSKTFKVVDLTITESCSKQITKKQNTSDKDIPSVNVQDSKNRLESAHLQSTNSNVYDVFPPTCSPIKMQYLTPRIKSYELQKTCSKQNRKCPSDKSSSVLDSSDSGFDVVVHKNIKIREDDDPTFKNVALPKWSHSERKQVTKSATELPSVSENKTKSARLQSTNSNVYDVFSSPCSPIKMQYLTPRIKSYELQKTCSKQNRKCPSDKSSSVLDSSDSVFDVVVHKNIKIREEDDPTFKNAALPEWSHSERKQVTKSATKLPSVSENKTKQVRGRRKVASDDSSQHSLLSSSGSGIEMKMKRVKGRKEAVISTSSTSSSTSPSQENLNDVFITSVRKLSLCSTESDDSAAPCTRVKNRSSKRTINKGVTESSSISENKVKGARGRKKVVSDNTQSEIEIKTKRVRGRKNAVISESSSMSLSSTSSLKEDLN